MLLVATWAPLSRTDINQAHQPNSQKARLILKAPSIRKKRTKSLSFLVLVPMADSENIKRREKKKPFLILILTWGYPRRHSVRRICVQVVQLGRSPKKHLEGRREIRPGREGSQFR